jgi:hypothetical protein
MSTDSLTSDGNLRPLPRNARPRRAGHPFLRYHLDVVAGDVVNVVDSIGGWLFDRSMAGWDVHVFLAHHMNIEPLRILGVCTFELDKVLSDVGDERERAAGLAVAADVLRSDERVDVHVREASRNRDTEVVLWGDGAPPAQTKAVVYRLGAAARVFKAHALAAAAGKNVPVDSLETLFRKGRFPGDSHLLPSDCLIAEG